MKTKVYKLAKVQADKYNQTILLIHIIATCYIACTSVHEFS